MISSPLDRSMPVPLHEQVEQYLRRLIVDPSYQRGELLPDEISIAQSLGVSRNTVRAGMSRLIQDGLIERRAGVGTRVVHRNLRTDIKAWHSFTKELQDKGIAVQTFKIETKVVSASKDVGLRLHLRRGTRVLRLDRVRGWDDEPVVYFRSYLHPRLLLAPDMDFTLPLYTVIERTSGITADHAREELTAIVPLPRILRELAVEASTPLLLRRRLVFDPAHRPIEFSEIHYRSDRFTLTLDTRSGA
ncbi:MAG TPA: GntR family transcriptional regulator [Fimbriimonas sp.]